MEPHLQQPVQTEQRVDASFKVEELQRNKTGYIELKHRNNSALIKLLQ